MELQEASESDHECRKQRSRRLAPQIAMCIGWLAVAAQVRIHNLPGHYAHACSCALYCKTRPMTERYVGICACVFLDTRKDEGRS